MRRLFWKLKNEKREYYVEERSWIHIFWYILWLPLLPLIGLGIVLGWLVMYPTKNPNPGARKTVKYKPGEPMVPTKAHRKVIKKELLTKKKRHAKN